MYHLKFIAIITIASTNICHCEEGDITYLSRVDGIQYECLLTAETIRRTGAHVNEDTGPRESASTENLGTITLLEAIKRADEVARDILGDSYTRPKPIWVMRSAERHDEEDKGGYYSVSYTPRRSLRDKSGGQANLTLIVLLNGEVLRPEKKP
jgi:hypothetical protein